MAVKECYADTSSFESREFIISHEPVAQQKRGASFFDEADTIIDISQTYYSPQEFLKSIIDKEFRTNIDLLKTDYLKARTFITPIENQINDLDWGKIVIEITTTPSLIFNILLGGALQLLIEIFFDFKDEAEESFFCLYKEKKCIANGMGTRGEVIQDLKDDPNLKEYFSQ